MRMTHTFYGLVEPIREKWFRSAKTHSLFRVIRMVITLPGWLSSAIRNLWSLLLGTFGFRDCPEFGIFRILYRVLTYILFDLTLIREAHTKISLRTSTSPITSLEPNKIKLIAFTLFSAWRVVSTLLIGNPPCHGDTRLLVIPFSCSRISDYNPCCILF